MKHRFKQRLQLLSLNVKSPNNEFTSVFRTPSNASKYLNLIGINTLRWRKGSLELHMTRYFTIQWGDEIYKGYYPQKVSLAKHTRQSKFIISEYSKVYLISLKGMQQILTYWNRKPALLYLSISLIYLTLFCCML